MNIIKKIILPACILTISSCGALVRPTKPIKPIAELKNEESMSSTELEDLAMGDLTTLKKECQEKM